MTSFVAIKSTLHPISFLITTPFDAKESATWFGVFHQVLHFPILAPSRCCLFRLPSFARWNLFWTPRPAGPCSQPITNHLSRDSSWKVVTCMNICWRCSCFLSFFVVFFVFFAFFCPRALLPTHYQSPFVWLILKGCEQLSKLCEKSWSICICWIKLGFYKIIFSLTSWFYQSSICNEKYAFLALLFHFWRCRKNKKTQLTKRTFTAHFTSLRDINQKIFPILTVTDMSANQWSQFIK